MKDTLRVTEPARLRTILVPIDFSACSRDALDLARSLAETAGRAHLILIHAYFMPLQPQTLAGRAHEPLLDTISQKATEELERILVELQDAEISAEFAVQRGRPECVIVDVATQKRADLIVMGTHGRTRLPHVLLGSVAERVERIASCPVMTIKPK